MDEKKTVNFVAQMNYIDLNIYICINKYNQ